MMKSLLVGLFGLQIVMQSNAINTNDDALFCPVSLPFTLLCILSGLNLPGCAQEITTASIVTDIF